MGALVSPIGMTRNSRSCSVFRKAVFHSWPAVTRNIVVASTEVELGVDLCAAQLFEEVGNEWNQVSILLSDLVEVSEVYTESQGAILLS